MDTGTQPDQRNDDPVRWHGRLRRKAKSNPASDFAWRLAVLVVGGAVLLAGLVMFITPGPGWAAIFLGLAILASEFAWARRLLDRVKATFRKAATQARGSSRKRKLLAGGLIAVIVVIVAIVGWRSGVDLPFVSSAAVNAQAGLR